MPANTKRLWLAAAGLAAAAIAALSIQHASSKAQAQPAPAPVISADFPEQAQPAGGCYAILNTSSAISAPRADRAEDQTGPLFVDACFGA